MAQVWARLPARANQRCWPHGARPLARMFALAGSQPAPQQREEAATPLGAGRVAPDARFELFVRDHERAILNYLWRVTGDEQTAYDLAQETFLRAWTRFERVSRYQNPRGWLFRVATNLALSSLARRRPTASDTVLAQEHDPEMSDPTALLVERDQVRATLLRLTPQRRAALSLREVYGLSCAEVAKALGISEAAARMTLSRAREQFRALYLREEGSDQ